MITQFNCKEYPEKEKNIYCLFWIWRQNQMFNVVYKLISAINIIFLMNLSINR